MSRNVKVSYFFSLLLATTFLTTVLLTTAGCGSDGPELGRVYGVVTNEGQPIEGVVIEFFPESGGRPSIATSDAKGKYELYYLKDKRGATIGKHKVKFEMRGPATVVSAEDQYGPPVTSNPGGDLMPPGTSFKPDSVDVKAGRNEVDFKRLPNE